MHIRGRWYRRVRKCQDAGDIRERGYRGCSRCGGILVRWIQQISGEVGSQDAENVGGRGVQGMHVKERWYGDAGNVGGRVCEGFRRCRGYWVRGMQESCRGYWVQGMQEM